LVVQRRGAPRWQWRGFVVSLGFNMPAIEGVAPGRQQPRRPAARNIFVANPE